MYFRIILTEIGHGFLSRRNRLGFCYVREKCHCIREMFYFFFNNKNDTLAKNETIRRFRADNRKRFENGF